MLFEIDPVLTKQFEQVMDTIFQDRRESIKFEMVLTCQYLKQFASPLEELLLLDERKVMEDKYLDVVVTQQVYRKAVRE
jgi:hypothetical protein